MDQSDFETQLRTDGYQEIELQGVNSSSREGAAPASFRDPGFGPVGYVSRHPTW